MEKVSINAEAKGFNNDRATVIIRTHYQEFEPNQATSTYHAYDYSNPQAASAFQHTMRINPSARKPINIGDLEWGKVLLVLSNDPIRTNAQIAKELQKAQEQNIISLTNADGIEVARIRPRHACVVEFPFPVFAQSSVSTALLSVTAYPILDQ
jgi:hypothetical protein